MTKLPKQVEAFHRAMGRLVAVQDVCTGLKDLASCTPDTYSFPGEFGDLPHALLRRTRAGLKGEAWANTEFKLSRDETGWLTLEFLAWWVRDLSRSEQQVQLRPMALPPKAYDVQLGRTLKYIIDHFVICTDDSNEAALEMMHERAVSLDQAIDSYTDVLGELAGGSHPRRTWRQCLKGIENDTSAPDCPGQCRH